MNVIPTWLWKIFIQEQLTKEFRIGLIPEKSDKT